MRPDAVPPELIERILEAATHAPSAENSQPWAFVVVRDASVRRAIGELTATSWREAGRDRSRRLLPDQMFADVDAWATGGLAQAPVHIVVCGDTTLAPEFLLPSSVFPAVQNLLLAAQAEGLGSLLSTLPIHAGDAFRQLLGLPAHVVALALVPVGYPAKPLGPARRQPLAEKVHYDRWGSGPVPQA